MPTATAIMNRRAAPSNRYFSRARKRVGKRGHQQTKAGLSEGDTNPAADEREDESFREEMPRETPARGAERGANRELPLPGLRPSHEQVRQVRAGNEKYESHRRLQRPDRGPGVSHHLLLKRVDSQTVVREVRSVEVRARPVHEKRLELRARPFDADAGSEATDEVEVVGSAVLSVRGIDRDGHEDIDRLGSEAETFGHHAHDLDRFAIDLDGIPHESGVGGEDRPPQGVSQNRDGRGPGKRLFGTDRSPEERRHSERLEELGADAGGSRPPGAIASAQVAFSRRVSADGLKRLAPLLELEKLRRRDPELIESHLGELARHQNEVVGARVGERLQKDAVHDGEDRRVGTDAEGERQESHEREARGTHQIPEGVPKILNPGFHRRQFLLSTFDGERSRKVSAIIPAHEKYSSRPPRARPRVLR